MPFVVEFIVALVEALSVTSVVEVVGALVEAFSVTWAVEVVVTLTSAFVVTLESTVEGGWLVGTLGVSIG